MPEMSLSSTTTSIKVALDWTPNPLHAGLFVAVAKGFYKSAGLDVSLLSPSSDNYATTPGKKLSNGEVDFCLCPSETVISFRTSSSSSAARVKACAALLSRDASAIVSRTAKRPSELVGHGKKYASYGARYEDAIVQAMVDKDAGVGGRKNPGQLETVTPAKLGIWETVIKGECDSTWIFEPFEGIQARRQGHKFQTFQLGDYGIPYGYSPLIAYNEAALDSEPDKQQAYRAFLQATGKGYSYAAQNTEEAAQIVQKAMQDAGLGGQDTDLEFLKESMQSIAGFYNLENGFGQMKEDVWRKFMDFLEEQKLLTDRAGKEVSVDVADLFTNDLLA